MQRLVLATIFLTVMGVIEASACNVVPFRFNLGTDTSTVMQVGSGKRCSVARRASRRCRYRPTGLRLRLAQQTSARVQLR